MLHINCTENYALYSCVYDVLMVLYLHIIQHRQRTYNVTFMRLRATIFCGGKTISIAYFESEFLTLGIPHVICMRHIVICGLPRCATFFRIIS